MSRYCWRIQKVGKDTTKKIIFLFSVGNISHLGSLRKIERPFESRIRQQYHVKCCVKEQVLVELELELAWSAYRTSSYE